jgi:hypothetical protein
MSEAASRPSRGLPPEKALRQWSEPNDYAELIKLSGEQEPPSLEDYQTIIREEGRRQKYSRLREGLEAAFKEKLKDGVVVASAIPEYGDTRVIIDPALWDVLELYYWHDQIVGGPRTYDKPEFFEPSAVPLNVRNIPEWLSSQLPAPPQKKSFTHDPSYQHVEIGGVKFTLGKICADVVKILHKAARDGSPWQKGRDVLDEAGSSQIKMGDLFKSVKDWNLLIKSDERGQYRLNLD